MRVVALLVLAVGALLIVGAVHHKQVSARASAPDEPCHTQIIAWNGMPLLTSINGDLRRIRHEELEVINALGKVSDVQQKWTSLAGHALAGLRNPPPTCLPGARTQWNTAMTDYLAAAGSYSKQDSQDSTLIAYQIRGATYALQKFTVLITSITG